MNWQRIKCAVWGHSWVVKGEHQSNIGAERNCVCGAHWPAVVWPKAPMPECKPPAPERIQVLSIKAGDILVITHDGPLNHEQIERIKVMALRALPADCKVLVLNGGLKVSTVVSARARTPVIPQPQPGRRS